MGGRRSTTLRMPLALRWVSGSSAWMHELLEDAVAACHAALEERTRERVQLSTGLTTQNNLWQCPFRH